jgi:hypothetical protein
MSQLIRIADSKGRIILPGFANATVIVEAVSENEYRLRRAKVIPEDELQFSEERMPVPLSERDAQRFVQALESPPNPMPRPGGLRKGPTRTMAEWVIQRLTSVTTERRSLAESRRSIRS